MKEKIEELLNDYKKCIEQVNEYTGYHQCTAFFDLLDNEEKKRSEILSLFPSLDNLEVVEECKECAETYFRNGVPHSTVCHCGMQEGVKAKNHTCSRCGYVFPQTCKNCNGTGKVTRAASWEDIDLVWLIRVATGICIVNEYRVPSGGILRVKGEE